MYVLAQYCCVLELKITVHNQAGHLSGQMIASFLIKLVQLFLCLNLSFRLTVLNTLARKQSVILKHLSVVSYLVDKQ